MSRGRTTVLLGAAIVLLGAVIVWLKPSATKKPPNILILSLCSLRYQDLGSSGQAELAASPSLDRFASQSQFVFENAFNPSSWVGLFAFVRNQLPEKLFDEFGYERIGSSERKEVLWIPFFRDPHAEAAKGPKVPRTSMYALGKNHAEGTAYLKELLLTPRSQPFYLLAHFKYMHFPLIDHFNPDSQWDFFLSGTEKAAVANLLAHPERFPEKLPFFLLLTQDTKVLRAGEWRELGVMTNPKLLAKWKESEGFAQDVRIAKKIYSANLRYFDSVLSDILELYGDRRLRENTVVIVTGDHGEMLMERGLLSHSNSLYDEALRVPLMIRLPDEHANSQHVSEQVDFSSLPQLVYELMRGKTNAAEVSAYLASAKRDVFVTRDCTRSQRGLRFQNKYKYIVTEADGARSLYDLEKDPAETHNLALENAQLADQMEEIYWTERNGRAEIPTETCVVD